MDGIFCFNTMVLANNGIEHAPLVAVESFGTRSHAFPGFGAGQCPLQLQQERHRCFRWAVAIAAV